MRRTSDAAFPVRGRVAVLSPHLDDAALSLGASIAGAARAGAEVRIVTVFAYDPGLSGTPGEWDAACGFNSVEDAAEVRRAEDARAAGILGADTIWLPYADFEYGGRRNENELWGVIADAVADADAVFTPGFPLAPPDHLWLTRLVLRRPLSTARIGLYVEQPYAAWRLMSRGGRSGARDLSAREGTVNALRVAARTRRSRRLQEPGVHAELAGLIEARPRWLAAPAARAERRIKRRAILAYRSQVRGFGPLVLARTSLYEASWGGEGIAYVMPRAVSRS